MLESVESELSINEEFVVAYNVSWDELWLWSVNVATSEVETVVTKSSSRNYDILQLKWVFLTW